MKVAILIYLARNKIHTIEIKVNYNIFIETIKSSKVISVNYFYAT